MPVNKVAYSKVFQGVRTIGLNPFSCANMSRCASPTDMVSKWGRALSSRASAGKAAFKTGASAANARSSAGLSESNEISAKIGTPSESCLREMGSCAGFSSAFSGGQAGFFDEKDGKRPQEVFQHGTFFHHLG